MTKIVSGDIGTPELHKHSNMIIGHTADNKRVAYNQTQVPLDYYFHRGLLDEQQYHAGQKLHELWYGAGKCHGPTQFRYGQLPAGTVNPDLRYELEERYNAATKAISNLVDALVVFNVCCLGEWAGYLAEIQKRKGMEHLRRGLDDLIKHFRM